MSKIKLLILLVALGLVYPTFVSANADIVAFTHFNASATTITAGNQVVFTINTIGASHVFADIGGLRTVATVQGSDPATGQASWILTAMPTVSQSITIFASATADATGAASVIVPITVNSATAVAPTAPAPQEGSHQILNIEETEASAVNMVTLTVTTNNTPGEVWMDLGEGRFVRATRAGQSGNQTTWTIEYRPPVRQNHAIVIYANYEYLIDGSEVSQNFTVTFAAPFVPPTPVLNPTIVGTTMSPRTVDTNGRTTITVRTNLDVTHVWAEVDNARVNARRDGATATTITWSIIAHPRQSQSIRIFANSENSQQGAVSTTETVSVVDRVAIPTIHSATANRNQVSFNEFVNIEVVTNGDADFVWAMVNGNHINASRTSTSGNVRTWNLSVHPQWTQDIRIYASRNNNDVNNAATSWVHITVTN